MGSSRKSSDQILGVISRRRAERLLTDWVNLHFIRDPHGKILENRDGGESAVVRMVSHYPEVFRDFEPSDHFSKLSLIALLLTVREDLRSCNSLRQPHLPGTLFHRTEEESAVLQ